jgi:hypothetical protein
MAIDLKVTMYTGSLKERDDTHGLMAAIMKANSRADIEMVKVY